MFQFTQIRKMKVLLFLCVFRFSDMLGFAGEIRFFKRSCLLFIITRRGLGEKQTKNIISRQFNKKKERDYYSNNFLHFVVLRSLGVSTWIRLCAVHSFVILERTVQVQVAEAKIWHSARRREGICQSS